MSLFQYGLCSDVKDLLLTMPKSSTLSQKIIEVVCCNNKFFERWQEKCWELPIIPKNFALVISSPWTTFTSKDGPTQIDWTRFKPLTEQEKQCCNPNIGFVSKCKVQGHMKPREFVWKWNTFSQVGDSAMISKCTPTLGVAFMWEFWIFKALVEKVNKNQIGYKILPSHVPNMFDLRKIWTFKILGQ
jgi:hypothetical protein